MSAVVGVVGGTRLDEEQKRRDILVLLHIKHQFEMWKNMVLSVPYLLPDSERQESCISSRFWCTENIDDRTTGTKLWYKELCGTLPHSSAEATTCQRATGNGRAYT